MKRLIIMDIRKVPYLHCQRNKDMKIKKTIAILTNTNQLAYYPNSTVKEVTDFLKGRGMNEIIVGVPTGKEFKIV